MVGHMVEIGIAQAVSEAESAKLARRGGDDAAASMKVLSQIEGETNFDYAYRTLRYNILMFHMQPGALLREASVAKRLGVSKTPVHQAVGILREQLLVDVAPQSATHISRINVSAMRQGSLLRTDVEAATLNRMAGRLPSNYIVRLGECLMRQREVMEVEEVDVYQFATLDDEFHRMVFEGSGMEFTWRSIQAAATHYNRVRFLGLVYGLSDLGSIYRDHVDLYKRLSFGTRLTRDQIYTFVYGHLNHYVDYFNQMVVDHPDFFDFGPVPGDTEQ